MALLIQNLISKTVHRFIIQLQHLLVFLYLLLSWTGRTSMTSDSEHLAEAFPIPCDVISILNELGKSTVKNQFSSHLFSEIRLVMFFQGFSYIIFITVVKICGFICLFNQLLSADLLLELGFQSIKVLSKLRHYLNLGIILTLQLI